MNYEWLMWTFPFQRASLVQSFCVNSVNAGFCKAVGIKCGWIHMFMSHIRQQQLGRKWQMLDLQMQRLNSLKFVHWGFNEGLLIDTEGSLLTASESQIHDTSMLYLSDDLSQARVAHDQPASGCDAIRLVLELFWVNFIEILEPGKFWSTIRTAARYNIINRKHYAKWKHRLPHRQAGQEIREVSLHSVFNDFRVDAGHAIDSMRAHNAQVGHVDLLNISLLNQGHPAHTINVSRVKFADALERKEKWRDTT